MQRFLDERRDLLAIFDSRLFITDLEGDAFASLPYRSQFIGINFADRDYMAGVLQRGQPTIGQPLIGRTAKVPVVVMAVPVPDADEKVIGALASLMNLEGPTFLDQMAQRHNGRRGTLTLIDRNRLIVLSTEPGRTMSELRLEGPQATPGPLPRRGRRHDHPARTQDGDRLIAVRRVPAADWLVLAALPTRKAFAPIRELQRRMLPLHRAAADAGGRRPDLVALAPPPRRWLKPPDVSTISVARKTRRHRSRSDARTRSVWSSPVSTVCSKRCDGAKPRSSKARRTSAC